MTHMTFAWPTVLAAFLASLVEFVEALTIVLAVGAVRGWRSAWAGTVAAALLLAVLIALFGPGLAHFDVPLFKVIVGTLLLLVRPALAPQGDPAGGGRAGPAR